MSNAPSVDGDLLDRLEAELLHRRTPSEAITSGELADQITDEDAEASPKTREAVKQVMRDRDLPVIGCSQGYYVPRSQDPIDAEVESLEGRIEGIRERQQLLRENWQTWQASRTDGGTVETTEATDDDGQGDGQGDDQDTTSGDDRVPDEVRDRIDADPYLTIDDWLAHNRGDQA